MQRLRVRISLTRRYAHSRNSLFLFSSPDSISDITTAFFKHQRSHFTASEPSPTQSTLFNSRPSTGKKYSQPPPSTHPTSSSPSNSSYNFGFDANAFKSHANARTDRAAQSEGHTAPQDPSPPSPTPQPQSYADRAADRADHMGNNRAAHKAGQPIRASKLGQKYYPSQDVSLVIIHDIISHLIRVTHHALWSLLLPFDR